jgi:hypothetical protein
MLAVRPPGEPACFVVNGEPFFPISTWGHGGYPGEEVAHSHMAELAKAGFNRFDEWVGPNTAVREPQTYIKVLDDARCHGLTVRFMIHPFAAIRERKTDPQTGKSVVELVTLWPESKPKLERFVQTVRDHKALFGYTTWDEPYWNTARGRPLPPREAFTELNDAVRELDPDHRVVCNFAPWEQVKHVCSFEGYREWTSVASAFTMDIYPVGLPCYENSVKLNAVAAGYGKLKEMVADDRVPSGMILQGCAWNEMGGKAEYSARPTRDGTRFMVYDVIAHGGKCIEWYGVDGIKDPKLQLWEEIKACVWELAVLQDILAGGSTLGAGDYTVPAEVNAIGKQYPVGTGPTYLIVTNPSEMARENVSIEVKGWPATAKVMFEGLRTVRIRQGRFSDRFDAWGVHVYTTDSCDWRPPRPRNARAVSSEVGPGGSVTLKASTINGAVVHWYKDARWQRVGTGDAYTFTAPTKPGDYVYWAFAAAADHDSWYSWTGDPVMISVAGSK